MQPDSVYPNDGEWFSRPEEDVVLERDQKRKLANAKPLIRDVVKRLEEQIEFYKNADNNPIALDEDALAHQKFAWCHREMRRILDDEKRFIESLL